MRPVHLDILLTAIERHTVLKLAGVTFPERLRVLKNRSQQIGGMLEMARLLDLERRLIGFLECHREALRDEIEGP